MQQKIKLRKKYLNLRKEKYYNVDKKFFFPLYKLIKKKLKKKPIRISLYYPSNFELNALKVLELKYFSMQDTLLPVIANNNLMKFYPWKKNEILVVNKFGMLEPKTTKAKIPDVMLIPSLAFDKDKFRLGYGGGYYDRFLSKSIKENNDILKVGVAFSFQKYHKLPINQNDVKLDFILTEKGIY